MKFSIILPNCMRIAAVTQPWEKDLTGTDIARVAQPDKDTAAALQFKRDGVTHVLSTAYLQSLHFAASAEKQDYRPKYALMSDAQIEASDRSRTGPPESFEGALDMTNDQIGSENTPGYTFDAATQRCRAILKGAGLADPTDPSVGVTGTLYGVACASSAMLVAALSNVSTVSREGLAGGLAKVGPMTLSFPAGPSIFNDPSNPTGGQYWRTGAFRYSACNCWQVTRTAWRSGFS